MGVKWLVGAARTDMQGTLLVDAEGKVLNRMSGDEFGHRVGEDLEIVRGTLCRILMDHISDAEFIFGDSIQAISQSPGSVQVAFDRNGAREFDLVIGADGLHSNVRRLVFGDERRFTDFIGAHLAVMTLSRPPGRDRELLVHVGVGRTAGMYGTRVLFLFRSDPEL